jgi:hypothetical protein
MALTLDIYNKTCEPGANNQKASLLQVLCLIKNQGFGVSLPESRWLYRVQSRGTGPKSMMEWNATCSNSASTVDGAWKAVPIMCEVPHGTDTVTPTFA